MFVRLRGRCSRVDLDRCRVHGVQMTLFWSSRAKTTHDKMSSPATLRPREASSGRMQTPILLLLLLLGSAQGFLPVPMTGCRVLPARAPPVGAVLAPLPICNRLRASGGARRTAARQSDP